MANILFIDDEEFVLNSLRRELRKYPHTLFFASSFSEAIDILENNIVNVLVTDMRMPDMNGLEILQFIKIRYPNIVKVVLSGFTQISQLVAIINQGDVFRFVKKPWVNNDELINALNDSVEYAAYLQVEVDHTDELDRKNQIYQKMLNNFKTKKSRLELEIHFIKKFYSCYTSIINKANKDNTAIMRLEASLMDCFPLEYEKLNCATINQKVLSVVEQEFGNRIQVINNCDSRTNIDIPLSLFNAFIRYFISQIKTLGKFDMITLESILSNKEDSKFIDIIIIPETQGHLDIRMTKCYFDEIYELFSPFANICYTTRREHLALVIRYDFTSKEG